MLGAAWQQSSKQKELGDRYRVLQRLTSHNNNDNNNYTGGQLWIYEFGFGLEFKMNPIQNL